MNFDIAKEDLSYHVIDEQLTFARQTIAFYTKKILELSVRRNSITPFSSLPAEILQYIFTLLAHDPIRKIDEWDWIVVTHVCHQWRAVAFSTRAFWSNIIICRSISMQRMQTNLALSGNADLYVTFEQKDSDVDRKKYLDVLKLVFGQMDRIVELRIDIGEDRWGTISELLQHSAPRLKAVDIEVRPNDYMPSFTGLEETRVLGSSLQYLRLKGISGTMNDLPILENLTHLTLESVKFSGSRLPNILTRCPKLESLIFVDFEISDATWPSSETELPLLRYLKAERVDPVDFTEIYYNLLIPDDCDWYIDYTAYSPSEETFNGNHLNFFIERRLHCEILHIATIFDEVFIESTSCSVLRTDKPDRKVKTTLKLCWDDRSLGDFKLIYSWISAIIKTSYWKSANMVQFRFDGDMEETISESMWIGLLEPLENVVFLGISFIGENPENEVEFTKALRQVPHKSTMRDGNDRQVEICPLLKDLSLRFARFSVDFVLELEQSLRFRSMNGLIIDNLRIYDALGLKEDQTCISDLSEFVRKLCWDADETVGDLGEEEDEEDEDDSDGESQLEDYVSDTTEEIDFDELDVLEQGNDNSVDKTADENE